MNRLEQSLINWIAYLKNRFLGEIFFKNLIKSLIINTERT